MNRREFLRAGGALGLASVGGGVAAAVPRPARVSAPSSSEPVLRLNYNENSSGLAEPAREAVRRAVMGVNRYPDAERDQLRRRIAELNGVARASVVLGNGSTEILQMIVQAAASPNATLLLADPTFEAMSRYQRPLSFGLEKIPLDENHAHDLTRMRQLVEARRRPTVVYLCNPNNPTGTLTSSGGIDAWIADAPESVLFAVDEAYFEYVQAPGYWSAVKWIDERPNVVVVRTFSKIYGMAGMRLGYAFAHPATARRLREFMSSDNANGLAIAAALAALEDTDLIARRRQRNAAARRIIERCLDDLGLHYMPSHASFLMHSVTGDLRDYIGRMRERGILVGRPFPPLLSYSRLSMGLPDEMTRVVETWRHFRTRGWI